MPREPKASERDADKWRIMKLEAEVTRLREALQPFARQASELDNLECDFSDDHDADISLGDCRRARAALDQQ